MQSGEKKKKDLQQSHFENPEIKHRFKRRAVFFYDFILEMLINSVSLFSCQLIADESAEQTAQFKKISSASRFPHHLQQ